MHHADFIEKRCGEMKQKRLVEKDFSSAKRIELDIVESKNELKAYAEF